MISFSTGKLSKNHVLDQFFFSTAQTCFSPVLKELALYLVYNDMIKYIIHHLNKSHLVFVFFSSARKTINPSTDHLEKLLDN